MMTRSPKTAIVPGWSGHEEARTISEQFFNLLKEWTYCDLVLDRELSDPLSAELEKLASQALVVPVNPKAAALPVDQCLMTARLSLEQFDILEQSIALSLAQNIEPTRPIRAVGGWVFSRNVAHHQIARRLEQAMIVRIQNAPDALLRIWDPRVIGHLHRILTHEQLAALLGPIECWAWIDRAGHLQLLRNPLPIGQGRSNALPLRLSPDQDAAIDRIEIINTLLKTLAKLGHTFPTNRDHELDELLGNAQQQGYTELSDLLAYCLHAVLISATFYTIPDVRQAIADARGKGLGLCSALERFDDAYWDAHRINSLAVPS